MVSADDVVPDSVGADGFAAGAAVEQAESSRTPTARREHPPTLAADGGVVRILLLENFMGFPSLGQAIERRSYRATVTDFVCV